MANSLSAKAVPRLSNFYEFNWGGFTLSMRGPMIIGIIPIKSVHQLAFINLHTAQLLIWMKGYNDINIISHSWGTTLSYDLMNSGGIEMHDWVTMGSPLKTTTDKPFWNTGKWINCYSLADPVVHYELYPPFPSSGQMVSAFGAGIKGGPGLSKDPNIPADFQKSYDMGESGFDEHGAYWKWTPLTDYLRKELQ